MKNIVIIFIAFLFINFTPFAYSFDICQEGAKAFTDTNAAFDEHFQNNLKDHNASGSAIVYDIYPLHGSYYSIILDCRNNVRLILKSDSGFLKDLKKGQTASFSGEIKGWAKRYYIDTRKPYIEIQIGSSSVSF